ncbi:MAG: hypothetical protein ACP5J4_19905 [Anaerolineae bacterium]
MTLTELAKLVWEMRQAQKTFFDRHTQTALIEAKTYERKVDAAILQILGDAITAEQGTLFPNQ